jgi:hypothetical protein
MRGLTVLMALSGTFNLVSWPKTAEALSIATKATAAARTLRFTASARRRPTGQSLVIRRAVGPAE